MKILITGSCGFIGFSFANFLLQDKKNQIIGIDNLNNYYSVKLKKDRLRILKKKKNFFFIILILKIYLVLIKSLKKKKLM